jgi:glyoxylase I family protein
LHHYSLRRYLSINIKASGVHHLAIRVTNLERVAAALGEAGVENTGTKLDEALGKRYVAFKGPDRIAWEFYMV